MIMISWKMKAFPMMYRFYRFSVACIVKKHVNVHFSFFTSVRSNMYVS